MNNLSKISSIIFRQIELAMPNFLMKLKLRTDNYSDAGESHFSDMYSST